MKDKKIDIATRLGVLGGTRGVGGTRSYCTRKCNEQNQNPPTPTPLIL